MQKSRQPRLPWKSPPLCLPPSAPICRRRGRRKDEQSGSTDDDAEQGRSSASEDAPLPRPKRRARRAKADRGLPPDEQLANLARAYLDRQGKHWPEMVQAGLLPQATDDIVHRMVEDFKQRHRRGTVEVESVCVFEKFCLKFGGNYNRFSCDNSSPLSIIDQMVNVLDKARAESRFSPWSYVFCD